MKNKKYRIGKKIINAFWVRESDLLRALKQHNTSFEVLFHKPTRCNALCFHFRNGVQKGELRKRILTKLFNDDFEGTIKNKELKHLITKLQKWLPERPIEPKKKETIGKQTQALEKAYVEMVKELKLGHEETKDLTWQEEWHYLRAIAIGVKLIVDLLRQKRRVRNNESNS